LIPQAYLQAWSAKAPWPDFRQVEQDLIICRALCDLFNAPALRGKIAFRGGTAINKLLFQHPLRYSEDIDLVQIQHEPIGATVDAIRAALAWLGKCRREQAGHSMHLIFKFIPEADTQSTLKLKVEINTREHENLFGIRHYPFTVENDWYYGKANIASFEPEELFGTKLRALLQRRKNRDLFDLGEGLKALALDADKLMRCLEHYLALEGKPITRAMAEQRMLEKLTRSLTEDIEPLLPAGVRFNEDDALATFERVWAELIVRLKGDGWKLTDSAITALRAKGHHFARIQRLIGCDTP
jgi:predicted nucleotidyltransferase component of viral defense system